MKRNLTRRDFLKLSSIAIGAAALPTLSPADLGLAAPSMGLGRATIRLGLMKRPRWVTDRVKYIDIDEVVTIYRAVMGQYEGKPSWHNYVWYEVEGGYLHSSWVQPVKNELQTPVTSLPLNGLFGEIYVPYTEAYVSPDTKSKIVYRLYYSSTFKITKLQIVNGVMWYHLFDEEKPNGFWIDGRLMRIITPDEITPISPDAADKRVVADLDTHWLSAYEGKTEVYRTRFASGKAYFESNGELKRNITLGVKQPIWGKFITVHMSGGVAPDGYDLPGVGWVSLFSGGGAAIHSTYWHNDFGRPRSAGCLNATPEAAKWFFRWTAPPVEYVPGKIEAPWPGGTRVEIVGTPPPSNNDSP
ncbi:MAG: L,D-transpeptidase family protein [Chloroflexota bacterium]|mgnify:CR=1 FL=1